jgi:quercetin dioxygenase-like cupin family protein
MYVNHVDHIEKMVPTALGLEKAVRQVLLGPEQGWEGWVMRLFTLGENGHSPCHIHAWPHINYIVSGQGSLYLDGQEHPLEKGSVAYVPGGVEHQFKNQGSEDFCFICIVPEEGDK